MRLTQDGLKAGTALTIDMLQAEVAADQARLNQATAFMRYNQSQVNLLAAMGLLDGDAIARAGQIDTSSDASPVEKIEHH